MQPKLDDNLPRASLRTPPCVLFLYNSTQTYTNTVWEHLMSFALFSRFRVFFLHVDPSTTCGLDLAQFDVVVVHYTLRLPFDQLSESYVNALKRFNGLKVVFQQDEYDLTERIRYWLRELSIDVMFTCVPENRIADIYSPLKCPRTKFVANLTGYVPLDLNALPPALPLADRHLLIGYRGRPLPYWYGALGQEKSEIGKRMRAACEVRGLPVDIEWTEEARIYGPAWYEFLRSCRAVLGTESGANVFDDEGSIKAAVQKALSGGEALSFEEVERRCFPGLERHGLMNQVSPKVFEAIALRVALVLYEGTYSGVVKAGEHYIPLKKDFSNIDDVLGALADDTYVERMTNRAYEDVIASGRYSYARFVSMVDDEIATALKLDTRCLKRKETTAIGTAAQPVFISTEPTRYVLPSVTPAAQPVFISTEPVRYVRPSATVLEQGLQVLSPLWRRLPPVLRRRLDSAAKRVVRRVRERAAACQRVVRTGFAGVRAMTGSRRRAARALRALLWRSRR